MFSLAILIALLPWAAQVLSWPTQQPLSIRLSPPKLHGRFLHITDMHPDPYYLVDASESSACHRKKPRKEKSRSGYYGTPFGDCDSPLRLTNLTLNFLDKNWASEIDFVVWTGDNARHDSDRKIPRTVKEIYDLNTMIATEMENIFLKKGVPVVPSLGNNDVWLFYVFNSTWPNNIINQFSSIWGAFVPFSSYQVFRRGAYYSVEVIPDQVAVISLNTMYFYDSNKAVGGCEYREPDDPGNLQFDWLEVQLKIFRQRGMQVWVSGHVPPSPGNYFPECYVRYVELSLRFQDTILGHLYGHMNNDHFFLLEAGDLEFPSESDLTSDKARSEAHNGLYDGLINDFGDLPTRGKTNYDNYGVINISPSVVPNPYLPSFRIYTYNITNAGDYSDMKKKPKRKHGHRRGKGNKAEICKKKAYKDSWRCNLDEPWHSDQDAPSRINTLWSPLGYAQYYVPKDDLLNRTEKPKFKLEYLTYKPEALHPGDAEGTEEIQYPIPLKQLPHSLQEGNKTSSKFAPYRMEDLTIPSWVGLARRLGDPSRKKLRRRFKQYMYMNENS